MRKESLYLATITVFLTGISLSTSVFADTTDTTDEIGIEIPISCTMSGTGTNTHYASIPNGIYSGSYIDASTGTSYANGIGTTTIKAFCNDNQGFSIYAIGYTDNIEGKTTLSNEQLGSTYDIITGTATGPVGSNDVSNWSMKLSTITSPIPTYPIAIQNSFDSYHEVPDDYTLVAKRESATDVGQNAVGSTLTTTYAAYISKTQPAGLYEGQVKYTMVHPYDAAKPIKKISIDTATTLQQVNTCSDTLTTGQVYTLVDSRDNEEYKVAKLDDGRCWMLENLRLDPTNAATAANMDETNTNAPVAAIMNYLNGGNPDGINGWSNIAVTNVVSDFNNNSSSYIQPRVNNQSKNALVTGYGLASSNGQARVGVYYNFCAATAGTYCYANGHGVDLPDTIIDAPWDICPANWRLPTSYWANDVGEYSILSSQYEQGYAAASIEDTIQYNLSTSLSGGYGGNSAYGQESYGILWSSTRDTSNNMLALFVEPHNDNFRYYNARKNGATMRCILKE